MTPEIGHFSIAIALALAIVQSVLPFLGAARRDVVWMQSASYTAIAQVIFLGISFFALIAAFVESDFTVLNVVENSHTLKPMLFKISGAWGSHEGSLLLWVFILSVFGALVALLGTNIAATTKARTLAVQAWISVGFLTFMLLTSNPFDRVFPPPIDGQDLNPLLQDVGLAMHPPLLYLGYVGFSIVFSFAVAALIEGRVDAAWARWVRPWALAAWVFLTAGIALGSWWAYYELGWGGWWFWDPVENVSFMPWLMGTALLHSAIVTEKRGAFKSWTILLAILTFSLSLLGTFIVRSGLLTSVHAFAVDPERGLYILGLLAVSIGGSFALYAWRAPAMEGGGLFKSVSRESGLLVNNLILAAATGVVLFGTLYPLFYEALNDGQKLSVGPPFFNAAFIPMMLPLVFVMGLGPFLSWKRADASLTVKRVKIIGLLSAGFGLVIWYTFRGGPVLGYISLALAAWLLLATLREWAGRVRLFDDTLKGTLRRASRQPRAANGMTLAHAGLAVAIFGFVGSSVWKSEQILFVTKGSQLEIAGFEVTIENIGQVAGPNFVAERGTLKVEKDGEFITFLYPERRYYPVAGSSTTESSIRSTLAGDLYASLASPSSSEVADGSWTLRILYEPLVNMIWLGSFLLVLGGVVSLTDRRLRVGAPRRTKTATSQTAVL